MFVSDPACARAGRALMPELVWVSDDPDFSPNPDLTPLKGRSVYVWPTAGELGKSLIELIPELFGLAGKLSRFRTDDCADGHSALSYMAEGWDSEGLKNWMRGRAVPVVEATRSVIETGYSLDDPNGRRPMSAASLMARWQTMGIACPGGRPVTNMDTVVRILEAGEHDLGEIHFDTFLNNVVISGKPMDDNDVHRLVLSCQRDLQLHKLCKENARDGLVTFARQNSRSCVLEYLDSLPAWDGVRRNKDFFKHYYGAKEGPYTSQAGINFFRSLVIRALQPGVQQDHMIVLEGAQGLGKSSSLKAICSPEMFTVIHGDIMNKDFLVNLQGKWIIEIEEMHAFTRAEISAVKSAISRSTDRFRPPYGMCSKDFPRQNCFIGTTNQEDWNRDDTGARRFWPIYCTKINVDAIKTMVPQFFAEALHDIQAGKPHWKMPIKETRAEQGARFDYHPWHEPVAEWMQNRRMPVKVLDALTMCIKLDLDKVNKGHQLAMASIFRAIGLEPCRDNHGRKRVRAWEWPTEIDREPGEDDEEEILE